MSKAVVMQRRVAKVWGAGPGIMVWINGPCDVKEQNQVAGYGSRGPVMQKSISRWQGMDQGVL